MVGRRDVVLLQVVGVQGTGFLIAPDKLATALHVIVELEGGEVVCDPQGRPVPRGSITCTYFSDPRGHWAESIDFVPSRDPFSIADDWVVLTVLSAAGARVWRCASASEVDRHELCSTYGFPPPYGVEGAPYNGKLTGIADPWTVLVAGLAIPFDVQVHRAWFVEAVSPSGLSPAGFSGAPVVVGAHAIGMVRMFIGVGEAGQDVVDAPALGATVMLTPIEALPIGTGIEPRTRPPAREATSIGPRLALVHIDTQGSDLLVDNWLLQSVSGLLSRGPETDTTAVIDLDLGRDVHRLRDVSAAGIEFECLISLINDIILRERLILDTEFANTWQGDHQIDALVDSGVLSLREIDNRAEISRYAKGRVIGRLCATKTLEQLNQEHLETVRADRPSPHGYVISQIVAGTAGNFGRSAVTRVPYSPHPVRQSLIEQTLFRQPTAVDLVTTWLESERAKVHSHSIAGVEVRTAHILLPALVVQVIQDSTSASELIPVALQYREKFAQLRTWIGAYQDAMDDEDPRAMQKRQKVLESVSRHLAGTQADSQYGRTAISIETGWFSRICQRFGVRGALNGIMMTAAGQGSLTKLLEMFDVADTALGYRIREHLWRRFRATNTMD